MVTVARVQRRQPTPAEVRLWSVLRGRQCGGLRFIRQAPAGQYVLDFYCPACRLVIEVDGAVHDVAEVQERDARRQAAL
jgi:very-short-patch-repair endonuclease